MSNPKPISFGKLGSVNVTSIKEELDPKMDIYAKYTSSQPGTCPNGSSAMRGGPSYSDDAGACAVSYIE